MFCALSDAFGSSDGRTCLGACALDCLLKEGPGPGDYELEEVMGALRYVSSLPRRDFPAGTARTVAARFRCFVERTVPLPAAAPGDSPRGGRAVAAAIVAFLQDPARSTTRGYETHRQRVLHELWDFADYILDESAPYPPPLEALMETDVSEDARVKENLTPTEKNLVDAYRILGPDERKAFSQLMKACNNDMGLLRKLVDEADLD